MFGFLFRKNKIFDRKRPEFYEDIVSKKEYKKILTLSEIACQRIGEIVSIQAGAIEVQNKADEKEILTLQLDNLVRKCKYRAENEWEEVVQEHFSRFPIDKSKAKFLSKDFEYARPLLKLLVRKKNSLSKDMIQRLDFPNTASYLILDYDERFHFLMEKDIQAWNVPKKELFDIALENIALEKIDIKGVLWQEKFELYTFFSGDFSASFMVELAKNAPFAAGQFGAVVAIPTKGSAFVHPLNSNTALEFITAFDDTLHSFYNEDEVPISQNYFWFYEGKFDIFAINIQEKKKRRIEMPFGLKTLLS